MGQPFPQKIRKDAVVGDIGHDYQQGPEVERFVGPPVSTDDLSWLLKPPKN
jgi:hypothetical protein